jgi:xanthine dehydrogenase accessory factor
MRDVLAEVERWQTAGKQIARATVISVAGSAPRGVGATLAVTEDDEISGSVSGGCVEPAVIEEGKRALRTGRPKLLQFGITEEQNVEQIGLSCGGEIRVFVEQLGEISPLVQALHAEAPIVEATVVAAPDVLPQLLGARLYVPEQGMPTGATGHAALDSFIVETARALLASGDSGSRAFPMVQGGAVEIFFAVHPAPPTLVIIGAGHISIPLTRLAKVLDYRVIVVDAREAFATHERLPEADELLVEWPDEALERLPLTGATAVAVLTHDDKFDVPALRVALQHAVSYVGAIGSRGTRERRNARLREAGVTDEQIARIHGPIGLDIGARTPEEIALAILAQVVAVRRGQAPARR